MNDYDRNNSPINYPKAQNKKAAIITILGLSLGFCIVLGALLALIVQATGGRGILQ